MIKYLLFSKSIMSEKGGSLILALKILLMSIKRIIISLIFREILYSLSIHVSI